MCYNCIKSVNPKERIIMLLEMFAYVDNVDEAALLINMVCGDA